MFEFIKQIFVSTMMSFSCIGLNAITKCVSMNNQEWKERPEIININNNEPILYPDSIFVNKFKDSCNKINNPYAKVSDIVKS